MSIRINLKGVNAGGLEAIPSGEYLATVFEMEQEVGEKSNQPYLAVTFKLQGGDYDKRQLWTNLSLQPQALWRMKQFLTCLGYTEEDLDREDFDIDPREICGKPLILVVGPPDAGYTVNKVNGFKPAEDDNAPTELTPTTQTAPPPSSKPGLQTAKAGKPTRW